MYFILDCEELLNENGEALLKVENTFRIGSVRSWKSGRRIPVDRLNFEQPIRIPFERLRGYQGPLVDLLDLGIPIMSRRLQQVLASAGVSNIEWFDAVLANPSTGEQHPYVAFNVVGLVAAADLAKSNWDSGGDRPIINVSFEDLVLDETKARGAPLFRLAENINALMIHQHVRDAIEGAGIATVRFIDPQDWMQI